MAKESTEPAERIMPSIKVNPTVWLTYYYDREQKVWWAYYLNRDGYQIGDAWHDSSRDGVLVRRNPTPTPAEVNALNA
jgi:hypothetical protein